MSMLRSISLIVLPVLAVAVFEFGQPIAIARSPVEGAHELPGTTQEEIKLSNGRLSINVSHRSLISILEQLSAMQDSVTILAKDKAIDRPVTGNFETAPLDLALRALLNDEDVLMLYGARGSVLKAVIVYPKGQGGRELRVDPGQCVKSTEQLMDLLGSSDEK
jgi:hypothetical protein